MNSKMKSILERIKHIEEAINKGEEYLETGQHSQWHGFRPLFVKKIKNGKLLPPHKDWVRNVFLPRRRKLLIKLQNKLDKLT